ncbi:MAG TPA: putative nucleotidyltransferase substrate binding domain-containing protein, partial [Acidimicrobiales bacterium]
RLEAFGFADAAQTRAALAELTQGLTRRSGLMQQMLPLLLEWLSEAPDPDLGLLGLRNLSYGSHRAGRLVETFRESPEAARRLCYLLGTTRLVHERFERDPALIADLADDAALARRPRSELSQRARRASDWRPDPAYRRSGLRHFARAEQARIQVRDVLGLDELAATEAGLSDLADAVLDAAVAEAAGGAAFAVIGMGRLGGAELSYASDLDVLFVFGDGVAPEAAEAVAAELLATVNGTTPSGRIFPIDANLRPEGKDGALARSLAGYANYYERWAATWERQALLRARPVAGDAALAARFMEVVAAHVWGRPFTAAEEREIRRLKARVERERIPRGEDPQFHLKLGRGSLSDIEWTVQLLQLRHAVRGAGTMAVLDSLRAAGHIDQGDADVLADAYRYCERARNRLFLVRGQAGDSLPTQADQLARLARSLDTTPAALRDSYRRVTRRARAVVERLFYGSG